MAVVLNRKLPEVLIKNVALTNLAAMTDTSSAVLVILCNLEIQLIISFRLNKNTLRKTNGL
jgi:hypothetical protein